MDEMKKLQQSMNYPFFINTDVLLWDLIEERLWEIEKMCEANGISKNKLEEQVHLEYSYIVGGYTSPLYYLLGRAVDDAGIRRSEIETFGSSSGAVIPNILGLTGVGVVDRLKKILGEKREYYPELFYGMKGSNKYSNPTNIRFGKSAYVRVIEAMKNVLQKAYNIAPNLRVDDFKTQRAMGLYISELEPHRTLSLYEEKTGVRAEDIPMDDELTMELFRCNELEIDGVVVKNPIRNDGANELISKIQPKNIEDIAFAMGLYYCTRYGFPDKERSYMDWRMSEDLGISRETGERIRVFREQMCPELLEKKSIADFERQMKLFVLWQVFPKVHIDSMIQVFYRAAYYRVHFPECRNIGE